MSANLHRRGVIAVMGGLSSSLFWPHKALAKTKGHIVIIGGGFGGATAAQTLRRIAPRLDITLIEPKKNYWACPFSNLVIGGMRNMSAQRFDYEVLKQKNIRIVPDFAQCVDPLKRTVTIATGQIFSYDRLIMSPGIDLRWNTLEGYDQEAAAKMPHAWKAGDQTLLLRKQLSAMPDGGRVIISVPAAPYRCPPGPYERASLIAYYLKTQKPKSKLIILDAKDTFSKQPLFQKAWTEAYQDILEWRGASSDGRVIRVDAASQTIFTDFETHKADVANIIAPQKAASIAETAGLTDISGWCPVEAVSFESALRNGIHVIGDSAIMNPMPKSAFSAGLQAKVCAVQIARLMSGLAPEPVKLTNICYSFVDPEQAVSITGVYDALNGALSQVKGAGGLSSLEAPLAARVAEGRQAADWYSAATREAFG